MANPSQSTAAAVPLQLTRFVGRAAELADLQRLLPTTRLLTLTGAGGGGKTRLASEIANRTTTRDAVVWVDLATIDDPALLVPHVALGLGIAERGDRPTLDLLRSAVGDRALLIVLDNCEHLVDVAAGLAEALLTRCPALTIVATSREALGVPGELAWLVPPMNEEDAGQLFTERAQSVLPSFAPGAGNAAAISAVCRRLDGLPLAIELAAARVRVLSPGQIAERLDDALNVLSGGGRTVLPRHRTLRGAIDWSYALLTDREQLLLRRLAVFAGPFTLEAAETVCALSPISADEVLDGVAALVDKSMVVLESGSSEARYRMLETIRQYAAELLRDSGELEPTREALALWVVAHTESVAHTGFGGAANIELVEHLTVMSGNLRAAADWCAERPERTELALRLGFALHWFWFAKGRFAEGRRRLEAALAVPVVTDVVVRGRAQIAAGHIALWQGDVPAILPAMHSGLELLGSTDDRVSLAYAHNGVGAGLFLNGDGPGAVQHLDRALDIIAEYPDHVLNAIVRYWRGLVALEAGEFSLARRLFQDAGQVGRRLRHRPAIGHPQLMLGRLATREERWREALEHFVESLVVLHEVGDPWGIAQALEGVAITAAGRHDAAAAIQFLGVASALRERIAAPHLPHDLVPIERVLAWARVQSGAAFDAAWQRARQLDLDDAIELARRSSPETGSHLAAVRPVEAGSGRPDLVIRALGPLEVLVDGEPISSNTWGSARARELLLFLACHPRGVSKEQVGAAFWPEASTAQVRNTFHVTLHRLRKALGHPEWIAATQDSYRLDKSVRLHFDAERFERELTAALRGAGRDDPGARTALTAALAHYRGDFLESEGAGDWSVEERSRLQRLHTDGYLALSALHLLEGHAGEAAESARKLLARDPLHEEGWRRLMTAHARMGERPQALRLHQQLTELLQRELGTTPDRATMALAQRLQAGLEV